MGDETPGGPLRLRGAGIGTIVGGMLLGPLSLLISYALAAAGTLAVGVVIFFFGRSRDVPTGLWLGCVAVGGIGLFEAFGLGLGIEPLFLAVIAVGMGLVDVILGGLLDRFRTAP